MPQLFDEVSNDIMWPSAHAAELSDLQNSPAIVSFEQSLRVVLGRGPQS